MRLDSLSAWRRVVGREPFTHIGDRRSQAKVE